MTGRPKSEQSKEKREHRTVVRWTKSERDRLHEAKEKLGLPFDVDVIRMFTLKGVEELLPSGDGDVAK